MADQRTVRTVCVCTTHSSRSRLSCCKTCCFSVCSFFSFMCVQHGGKGKNLSHSLSLFHSLCAFVHCSLVHKFKYEFHIHVITKASLIMIHQYYQPMKTWVCKTHTHDQQHSKKPEPNSSNMLTSKKPRVRAAKQKAYKTDKPASHRQTDDTQRTRYPTHDAYRAVSQNTHHAHTCEAQMRMSRILDTVNYFPKDMPSRFSPLSLSPSVSFSLSCSAGMGDRAQAARLPGLLGLITALIIQLDWMHRHNTVAQHRLTHNMYAHMIYKYESLAADVAVGGDAGRALKEENCAVCSSVRAS